MKDSWVFLWAFPKFDEIVGQVKIQTTSFEKLNLEPPCNFNQLHGDSNFKYAEISSPKILWSSKTIILAGELQFYQLQRKRPEKKRKKKKERHWTFEGVRTRGFRVQVRLKYQLSYDCNYLRCRSSASIIAFLDVLKPSVVKLMLNELSASIISPNKCMKVSRYFGNLHAYMNGFTPEFVCIKLVETT